MNLPFDNLESYEGTGRVLRIKEGFNPNSSSCGSIVFSMQPVMLAIPVLLAGAAAWIAARMLPDQTSEKKETQKEGKS